MEGGREGGKEVDGGGGGEKKHTFKQNPQKHKIESKRVIRPTKKSPNV
jgi:hypothetical protein